VVSGPSPSSPAVLYYLVYLQVIMSRVNEPKSGSRLSFWARHLDDIGACQWGRASGNHNNNDREFAFFVQNSSINTMTESAIPIHPQHSSLHMMCFLDLAAPVLHASGMTISETRGVASLLSSYRPLVPMASYLHNYGLHGTTYATSRFSSSTLPPCRHLFLFCSVKAMANWHDPAHEVATASQFSSRRGVL
jgi:hypothetical protein